jgi:charged multivesicular body protein 7
LAICPIHQEFPSRTETIKSCLATGRKELAVAHLRSRKALEELLTQRLGSLLNLNQALLSVDQAHSDATIVRAYEASSRVLKEILSKPELQTGRVEAVMASLAEGMEDAEELRQTVEIGQKQALEAAGVTIDDATEEQIQMELEVLVDEQNKQEAERAKEEAVRRAEKETELAAQRILATLEAPDAALARDPIKLVPETV